MGGSAPSAPTLDTGKSTKLTRADYALKEEFTPRLTESAGKAGREEYARNISFALRGFTNPSSIYQGEIEDLRKGRSKAEKSLASMDSWRKSGDRRYDPKAKKWISSTEYDKARADAQKRIDRNSNQITKLRKSDPVKDLQKAFRPEFRQRDKLLGQMQNAQQTTGDFKNYQKALRKGIGAGKLGDGLMKTALDKVASGGKLNAQASRDATQAARQGMAARGMATSNAGLAAELLNRDQYSRQREFQNLGFAQDVQAQDLNRRTANLGYLGQAAQNMDLERARKLGLSQDSYNFRLATNPKMMLSGLGSPYANFTPQAIGLMGGQNVQPMYSGGQFSSGGGMGTAGNIAAGAAGGALMGAPLGPWGMAGGAVLGGGMAALSSR
jgi:hypothetical protein